MPIPFRGLAKNIKKKNKGSGNMIAYIIKWVIHVNSRFHSNILLYIILI